MAFKPDRLTGLRETKAFSQEKLAELAGLSQSLITKVEKGKSGPSGDVLEKLACALDCTMDYLYGRGGEHDDYSTAASHMAFEVFARDESATDEQRGRCQRALKHPDAPKTAKAWRSLAEMIELGIGPTPSSSANLAVVKHRPSKSRPVAMPRSHRT